MGSTIIGCGKCLPALEVENDELKALVDTNDEWISTRTGIKSRRVAVDETNSDLAEVAARQALGWIDGGSCRATPRPRRDRPCHLRHHHARRRLPFRSGPLAPPPGPLQRHRLRPERGVLGLRLRPCDGRVDDGRRGSLGRRRRRTQPPCAARSSWGPSASPASPTGPTATPASCSGTARAQPCSSGARSVPGILSSFITNEDDEANALTCAAAYEAPQPFDAHGISLDAAAAGDPGLAHVDEELAIGEAVADGKPRQVLRMNGPKVFKFASEAMTAAIRAALDRANLSLDDVACIVPPSGQRAHHQVRSEKARLPPRPVPALHRPYRQLVGCKRAHGPCRCLRKRAHSARRQGGARRVRRRLHLRCRGVRGVNQPALSALRTPDYPPPPVSPAFSLPRGRRILSRSNRAIVAHRRAPLPPRKRALDGMGAHDSRHQLHGIGNQEGRHRHGECGGQIDASHQHVLEAPACVRYDNERNARSQIGSHLSKPSSIRERRERVTQRQSQRGPHEKAPEKTARRPPRARPALRAWTRTAATPRRPESDTPRWPPSTPSERAQATRTPSRTSAA